MSLLDDITTRGAEMRERLRELLLRHKYAGNTKNMVLAAYVDIALEHHKAIWHLSKSGLNGSAFALVRLILDAFLRALWINKVATPEQIEQAGRDELKFPKMSTMRADIKKAYFDTTASKDAELAERAKQVDRFFQLLFEEAWPTLCSYTHSGGLQIGRRFTGAEVRPKYSEGAIAEALNFATVALMLLLHTFFVSMKCYEEVKEIRTLDGQYYRDFGERLRKGQ